MRPQIAILVLVLAAAAVNAAELNCTTLAKPNHNFYEPSGACANDTVIDKCLKDYFTCVDAATTCDGGFVCVSAKLRCLENAAPGSECASWAAMLGNEKLYIAAGVALLARSRRNPAVVGPPSKVTLLISAAALLMRAK